MNPDDPESRMVLDLQLSLLARNVDSWVAKKCFGDRRNFVDPDRLNVTFKENPEDKLEEAIAELETDGFVEMSRPFGGSLPYFRPTLDLYLTFDGSSRSVGTRSSTQL